MMIININNEWRIRTEPLNWIIEKRVWNKDKEKWGKWSAQAYPTSLASALYWLMDHQVKELPGEYGPEALKHLTDALAEIKDIISQVDDAATNPTTNQQKDL